MHQHLPNTSGYESHGSWNGEFLTITLELVPGTLVHSELGPKISVNSTHHQGLKTLVV